MAEKKTEKKEPTAMERAHKDVAAVLGGVVRRKPLMINIESLSRGYVVNIGCATFSFVDIHEMLAAIAAYLENPKTTEAAYNEAAGGPMAGATATFTIENCSINPSPAAGIAGLLD